MCHMDIRTIKLSKRAMRDLKKVPRHVVQKLMGWSADVADDGLSEVRKRPGYHDEPLKGKRDG